MVVAAGGEERRGGQLRLFLEAERVAVERRGAGHVGDLQVHVPDAGVRRDRGGGLVERLREQVLEVERQGGHVQAVAVAGALPALARSVGVELDAEAVGVAEIQRLGDAVVGGALERPARAGDAPHAVGERGAAGMQPGDVVEAGGAARQRRGSGDVAEYERRALEVRAEPRDVLLAGDQRQAEHALVEVGAARQVAHGERDRADAQIGVDRGHLRML